MGAWRTFVCGLGLALVPTSSGCVSASLASAAASSAAAAPLVAVLPITLALDGILLGLAGASMAPAPPSQGNYANYGWKDPDDWVAQCEGPLHCPEHRHFVCSGSPGNCECHCEVTPPACVPGLPVETARIACGDKPPAPARTKEPPGKPVAAR
ncbi:MAG TPA: hypothetical protein VFB62_22230 [Polyangiaceae bacterium]|nr:hypothetical protein [Polyangiaceae bacterium]